MAARKIQVLKKNKKWKRIGYGAYGAYFQISKYKGVKVLHDRSDNGYSEEYTNAELLDKARKELKLLKKASKTGFAPKGYKVVKVDWGDGYYGYGIVMQHIHGSRYFTINSSLRYRFEERRGDIGEYLQDKFDKVGIHHGDLHSGNILGIVKNKKITKVYAVDFSPECSGFY